MSKATLAEQQDVNVKLAADFAVFIRQHEPQGVTVSVGGEIGEVGGKNSDVHELHAYMSGFNAELARRSPSAKGLSKISVQTGTAHGGFVNADGTVRMDVQIDLQTLEELSRLARTDYGLGGAVQHGASTLPPEAFDAFPRARACEIHLATDFQNMVYDHPRFPKALKAEMYAWLQANATEERKPKDTEEQFIYKARKKAIGPFKQRMWGLPDADADGDRPVARGAVHVPDASAEHQRHGGRRLALREDAGAPDRSRSRDRGGRRQDHRGRTKGRRPGRLGRMRVAQAREVVAQAFLRAAERELVPGDRGRLEERRVETFLVFSRQRAADRGGGVHDDDRRAARVGIDVHQPVQPDVEAAFLAGFADCRRS